MVLAAGRAAVEVRGDPKRGPSSPALSTCSSRRSKHSSQVSSGPSGPSRRMTSGSFMTRLPGRGRRARRGAGGARRGGSCRALRGWWRGALRARRSVPPAAPGRRTPRADGRSARCRRRRGSPAAAPPVSALSWALGPRSAKAFHASSASGISRPCHARRRAFTPASSSANLYAQVVKRLAPRKPSSLASTATSASPAACTARSSRSFGDLPAGELVVGGPQQQRVQLRNGPLVIRAGRPEAPQPGFGLVRHGRASIGRERAHRSVGVAGRAALTARRAARRAQSGHEHHHRRRRLPSAPPSPPTRPRRRTCCCGSCSRSRRSSSASTSSRASSRTTGPATSRPSSTT